MNLTQTQKENLVFLFNSMRVKNYNHVISCLAKEGKINMGETYGIAYLEEVDELEQFTQGSVIPVKLSDVNKFEVVNHLIFEKEDEIKAVNLNTLELLSTKLDKISDELDDSEEEDEECNCFVCSLKHMMSEDQEEEEYEDIECSCPECSPNLHDEELNNKEEKLKDIKDIISLISKSLVNNDLNNNVKFSEVLKGSPSMFKVNSENFDINKFVADLKNELNADVAVTKIEIDKTDILNKLFGNINK